MKLLRGALVNRGVVGARTRRATAAVHTRAATMADVEVARFIDGLNQEYEKVGSGCVSGGGEGPVMSDGCGYVSSDLAAAGA